MPHAAGAPSRRHRARRALALVAAIVALAGVAAPVEAKELVLVTLEAPIAMDSPPGAVLLVGIDAAAPGQDGQPAPVVGTPFALRLTGRDGTTTRAAAEGTATPGHYLFRIEVPAGGPRRIEMGIHGSTQEGPVDLPVRLVGPTLVSGPIREGTAQLDPAAAAAASPATGTVATRPAAAGAGNPAAEPASAPAGAPGAGPGRGPALLAGVLLAGVLLAAVAVLLVVAGREVLRRRRDPAFGGGTRSR